MIPSSKRIELAFLAILPAFITFVLAIIFMSAKHIRGMDHFMPVLPVIPIFYWGIAQARDMSYIFVFLLGIMMDAVSGLPLGITSLTFLLFMIVIHTQRKYIHKEGFVIKWFFFAGILVVIYVFNWMLLTFFYSHAQTVGPAFIQWFLTVCCYPFLHKGFDGVYEYIHSRRWQILHGR